MNVNLRGIGARADGGAGCAGILNPTNKLHAVNERHIRSFVGFGLATIISPATSAGKREVEIRCSGGEVRWQRAGLGRGRVTSEEWPASRHSGKSSTQFRDARVRRLLDRFASKFDRPRLRIGWVEVGVMVR